MRAMISPIMLERRSWLQKSFIARALETSPSNTPLSDTSPSISLDEIDLHRKKQVHLARLRCGYHLALRTYENRLTP